jgi:NAD-dependent SIR2 family protein deacetylase
MKSGEPVFCNRCKHAFPDNEMFIYPDGMQLCADCEELLEAIMEEIYAKLQTPVRSEESEKRNSD